MSKEGPNLGLADLYDKDVMGPARAVEILVRFIPNGRGMGRDTTMWLTLDGAWNGGTLTLNHGSCLNQLGTRFEP